MGLSDEAEKFAKAAEKLNSKKAGGKKTKDQPSLGREAQQFAELAKDFNAKMYTEANIVPQIDGLIDRHKDGSGIPKSEIIDTFKEIMSQMVKDNVMTQEEMSKYTAPSKEPVPKKGIFSAFQQTEYSPGPSQFERDIDQSIQFKDGKLESPNLESFKDKLMNVLSKICDSLELKDLAQSCRQSISKGNLEKTYVAEKGMSNLTSKVAEQAKSIGTKVAGIPEAKRVANMTQNTLAKRQQPKDSGHSF